MLLKIEDFSLIHYNIVENLERGRIMKYFITSDVHSFYEELIVALNDKGFEIENEEHKLVVCGDLFDRGDGTKPLYDFIKDLHEKERLIYIRGNHEDLLFDCVNEIACGKVPSQHHFSNGTVKTICMFCGQCEWIVYDAEWRKKIVETMSPILEFIKESAVDYFETERHIFVHGWIPCESIRQNPYAVTCIAIDNWRSASENQWRFARWINGMGAAHDGVIEENKTIVCGHWHCNWGHANIHRSCSEWGQDAIFEPFVDEGIIAIDACTAHSGKINVVIIED